VQVRKQKKDHISVILLFSSGEDGTRTHDLLTASHYVLHKKRLQFSINSVPIVTLSQ